MNPVPLKEGLLRMGQGGRGEDRSCVSSQTVVPPSTCQKGLVGHQQMVHEPLQISCTGTSGKPLPTHAKHT